MAKTYLDTTCPRCGFLTSTTGLDFSIASEVASIHVCADGVKTPGGAPVKRVVPGIGERKPRLRATLQCNECGKRWRVSPNAADPQCPRCNGVDYEVLS